MTTMTMIRFFPAFVFTSAFLGCTTTSNKDTRITPSSKTPAYDFVVQNRDHTAKELEALSVSEDNQKWWKSYRLGLLNLEKNPVAACTQFDSLAKEVHFPLKDIALLRAHQTCVDSSKLPKLNADQYRSNYKWSQDVLADVTLKESRKSADKKDDLEALKDIARLENIPRKKEQYLLEALKIAEELKVEAEIDAVKTQLYRSSPRLKPDLTLKEIPTAAMDHRQRREFDKALVLYKKILKDPKASEDDIFQALKNIRMTYKVAQNKNAYIDATTQLVNGTKATYRKNKKDAQNIKRLHESYVLLARTLWTEDRLSLALKALTEAQRQLKGQHPLDEIYFVLGRIAEEKNDLVKASEYYDASLKEPLSSSSIRERVLWLHPWVLYKMKKYDEAAQKLQEFAVKAKDNSDRMRSLFWQARALKNLNKTEEAKTVLQQLVKDDQIGYYGVMAVRELGQSYAPMKSDEKDFTYSLFNLKEMTPTAALQAEWLMAVGENTFSEKIIDQLSQDLRQKGRNDEETWLIILTSYARANLYLPLFAAFNTMPADVKDKMVQKHPELLFPRNYKDIILQAAQAEQIPPELVFSIIRQESAFNPRARSPVDAFGLMQLLPNLGQQLSKKSNIAYKEPEDLFDPEINVPLGSKELKTLLNRYDQQYILAVAAYNASGNAIRGWLKTRFREDSLEFIEEVPYDETRAYIKLVMRNFVFYKRLNQGDANQTPTLNFPEEWLKLVSK
ncbi:transglycosylase SLT domain-containing protein [Bdellovibrio sp. HCB337]|uniref:transglycosylase SLT domain-containing protein n=1 Tax=Bdellovibrio sp. HCB337 TaxID=3394358 RepID=UPI0039A776EC